ncbi:hypothetical protein [Mycoplasma suis]|uniref:Uncharacterized protein n=1 Tax=Mycoplasma suis (strain Illinois) TaxID=768700 RepID=F0QRY8_MYCSL|nr:hypothetical protein [Mycoplasma suis]ADX98258.1 hypothetical protein MSU_0733 [Mycoplasma suis str. Illinois]
MGFLKSFVDLGKSLWKLKDKNWKWKEMIPDQQNQQNELQQSDSQQQKVDWRDLFNGLWVLCHFQYRDVFEVEFGSVFSLIWWTIIDAGKWDWWDWEKIQESLKNIESRLEESLKSTLKFLVSLKILGEKKRGELKTKNQDPKPEKIKLTRNNMKWANYVWLDNSQSQKQ